MLGFAPIGGAPIGGVLFSSGGGGGGGPDAEVIETFRWIDDLVVARVFQGIIEDALDIEPLILLHFGIVVTERLGIQDIRRPGQLLGTRLVDTLTTLDSLRLAYAASLTDGIAIAMTEQQHRAVLLVEQLHIANTARAAGYFGVTLKEQVIRLRDTLAQFFGAEVVEGLAFDPDLSARELAMGKVTEDLALEAVLEPQFILSAVLRDGLEIEDEKLISMLFQPTLIDGIEISAGYLSPGGSFTAWTMNARTGAVSEYTNYEFNSFAQLGGRYIGASSDGLYDLMGDDDDGEDIIARLRGGFMQFGGTHLSRLKAAYIAARGEGDFVLKIETADGVTYTYETSTRNMRSTKVHMGKGQRARYFNFELISTGQDFDLDTLEFVPIVVQRRV